MGKYKENRHRAKTINDLGDTGRLVLMGVQRNLKEQDEVKVQQFIKKCQDARTFLLDVMQAEGYGLENGEYLQVKEMNIKSLDECTWLGEKMIQMQQAIKKHAGIHGLMYPFLPMTFSRFTVTTFELLAVLAAGLVIIFVL